MTKAVEVKGLEPLIKRMRRYPAELAKVLGKTMVTALLILNENVPPYPPEPTPGPGGYKRTGLLGRSLGSNFSGGKSGTADIFQVKRVGGGNMEGHFGTRVKYAPKVIGSKTQQDPFFAQYWWRLEQIIGKAFPKIMKAYNTAADKLAAFLDGK